MSAWDPEEWPPPPDPDIDDCIDCGVDQVGRQNPYGSYHAPGCAFYVADTSPPPGQCLPCQTFFARFDCAAAFGECDCPRCQGLCYCTSPF